MGRAKYPTPDVAVTHFTDAVTSADVQAKWGRMAAEGAPKLGDWFTRLFPKMYSAIARLPAEPKDPWLERSKPIGQLVKREAAAYRKAKVRALAGLVPAGTPPPATPPP